MNSNNYLFEIQVAKTTNGQKNGSAEESSLSPCQVNGPQVQQLNRVHIVEGNFLGFSRLMAH